jgi:hypothetical protein
MKKITSRQSLLPILIMVGFTLFLLGALVFRVFQADKDLGLIRVSERQARLAAESGVQFVVSEMNKALASSNKVGNVSTLSPYFFTKNLPMEKWIKYGQTTNSSFKIVGVRKVGAVDSRSTKLINEGTRFQVICEGRSGRNRYSSAALVQLYDIVSLFSVFKSLDEYYYGKPIQPWIEKIGSFGAFKKRFAEFFSAGLIDNQGVCHDPKLLVKLFAKNGSDPFQFLDNNYGRIYTKDGKSPCIGPLYTSTPIVIDTHQFSGPIQTSQYFYRRSNTQPRISLGSSIVALNSSLRVQHAADNLEGKIPRDWVVDRDSLSQKSFIPSWRPNFDYLRKLAKEKGIYIDQNGNGFQNGSATEIKYHPGESLLFSDSYKTANSAEFEQDKINEKYIILSTEMNFEGYNNLSSKNLSGARILFSERAIYLRGDIGSDLIVVTPEHIYLTGPTNVDSGLNLFLVAGQGVALSTVDLEKYIKANNVSRDFIDAAREWLVRAVIYKPGSGIYSSNSREQKDKPISFKGIFSGRSLKLTIVGACLEGNLQRWIDNSEKDSLNVKWDNSCVDRLMVRPITASPLRIRTRPVK